ncbi:MAG TPA: biosynthetic-type acetolactate synthase large subunit [Kiritimatiellia bacterium]|nr:biosynthetic-type acetolactate synthase large subunit [Kiritimatiellia bacterium]HMP00145.1 biosynthetic-type acetolactate synthase large subunit [Kiritimatiellia bacterium]
MIANATPTTMEGAQALVKCLERQGVEYIWGLSGGAAIPIFDALITTGTKIKLILVRHEQGATHMADGYARATGKPGVVLVTSGPGATNTITGIMTAHMDSVPMIVITGQTITSMLGKDAFQEADVFGLTMPVVKHSYLIKNTQDIPRIVKEAFHIASTGRPGPVLMDIPKDISSGQFSGSLDPEMDLPGYNPHIEINQDHIMGIAEALRKSKRPVILAGHGALISRAFPAIEKLAETLKAPVTTTLLGKGAFNEEHPLALGMLGMHGTAYANKAMVECDLVMSIGSRYDDRIIGQASRFCRDAVRIHIDIDIAEINKMINVHHYCIGDARLVVEELIKHASELDTKEWLTKLNGYKKKYPLKYGKHGGLKMQHVLDELYKMTGGKIIVSTDVGQHQMWAAQFLKTVRPDDWLSSGGAGTMGYGFPAAMGAQWGKPDEQVWAIVGDGGFQMTMCELATACVHKLPVKILVLNNHYLGMVRQWQELFYDDRTSGVDLEGNPDFAKMADCFPGAKGFTLKRPADVRKILKRAMDYNDGPCVINAECEKTDNVFPMIPAGRALEDMIIERPRYKMEKPTGST